MIHFAAALLLTYNGHSTPPPAVRARVDILEHNTVTREGGDKFVQWIFWQHDPVSRGFVCIGWMRAEPSDNMPWRSPLIVTRFDGRRAIYYTTYRRTESDYDPEVNNRDTLAAGSRRPVWYPILYLATQRNYVTQHRSR